MEFQEFKALYEKSMYQNALDIYCETYFVEKFYQLTEIMMEVNQNMNLTAIREVEKIIPLHYADCLKIVPYITKGSRVIDIGCGGGFPTLPLAIVRQDINIIALDSTEKKVRYVGETAKKLGLDHVNVISTRAEDLAHDPAHRETYDVAVSRAVARLNILTELCLPFVKEKGRFIAMKGPNGSVEWKEAQNGIEILGGDLEESWRDHKIIDVNGEIESRYICVVKKLSKAPDKYPRSFGTIKKKPL